jgi:uncharacterized repeat protein (TIGR01451 family)
LSFEKTLLEPANPPIASGQVITFSLTITNTSNQAVVKLPVQDRFDPDQLTFLQAAPPPDLTASGIFTWTDLLSSFGLNDLPPNATISTTMSFLVNSLPDTTTAVINKVDLVGVRRDNSTRPIYCSSSVSVAATPPTPTPTATPDDDDDDDDETPRPTRTPSPAVTVTPGGTSPATPEGTPPHGTPEGHHPNGTPGAQPPPGTTVAILPYSPVLPVNLLPETGTRDVETGPDGGFWLLGLIVLGAGSMIYLHWRKR